MWHHQKMHAHSKNECKQTEYRWALQTDRQTTHAHAFNTYAQRQREGEGERERGTHTHTCKLSGGDIMFVMYAEHNMENETSDWNSDAHGI